jgi:hypothetical protein
MLPDARLLDRLVRGRLWIGLLAAGLVGVVFLQISLLKLNTGISRAVQTEQTLERQNTELKLELSRLAGGERIQVSAAAMGFVVPAVGQPRFLDAKAATAARAAESITAPAPIRQLPLGMIPPADGGTSGAAAAPEAPAPLEAAGAAPSGVAAPPSAAPPSAAPPSAAPPPAAPAAAPHAADHPTTASPPTATGGVTAAGQGG